MSRKRSRTPEEIACSLDKLIMMLGQGSTIVQVCSQIGISEMTYYRWKRQYREMSVADVKQLKALQKENANLKRLFAEAELEKLALKELAEGNF